MLVTFASAKVTIVRTRTVARFARSTNVAEQIASALADAIKNDEDKEDLINDIADVLDVNIDPVDDDESSSDDETTTSSVPEPTTTTTTTTTTKVPPPTTTTTTTTTTTVAPVPTECTTEVFGVASEFNGFFFGDFVGISSDVQGRLAAKGNIDISGGYQNGAYNFDPVNHSTISNYDCNDGKVTGSLLYSIIAGGSVNYRDHGEILNGGVAYGNEVSLPHYIQEALDLKHCPVDKKRLIDFDKEKDRLTTLSENLGDVDENAKLTNEWGKLIIDLVPGQKLYTINADQISQYWDIEVRDNGVNTDEIAIVLNFTGSTIVLKDFNVSSLNKYATKTIWNAPNAKNIKIENFRIQGTLLAPNADIDGNNANIQGHMIANNFKGNLQIDWVPFLGCIDTSEFDTSFLSKLFHF